MNFPITITFKHFDKILLRVERARKGTIFMPFLMSVICFVIDWFVLRHYLTDSLFLSVFRSFYVFAGLTYITTWLIKLYNDLCDIKDEKEKEKQDIAEQNTYIKKQADLYSPLFNNFSDSEKNILKEISKSNNGTFVFGNTDIVKYSAIVQKINNDLFLINPQTQLIIRNGASSSIIFVSNIFKKVLEKYFGLDYIN